MKMNERQMKEKIITAMKRVLDKFKMLDAKKGVDRPDLYFALICAGAEIGAEDQREIDIEAFEKWRSDIYRDLGGY